MDEELSSRHSKQKPPKKKKKGKGKIVALVILIILAVIAAAGALWWKTQVKPPEIPIAEEDKEALPEGVQKNDGVYSVLVVGTDKVGLNTDTIFVASFDTVNDKISVMSVPRDTMSANVKRSVKKINAAYSVGGKPNMDNLKKEIRALVGFTPNYYVVVNLDAFAEVIDAIGGVKIDVPRDMNYDDPYQDLHIHLKKGEQVLNGQEAIGFVRYRKGYAEGDLGRVKAQQQFMTALAQQLAQPSTITKLPTLADIINKNMKTDMTISDILWFGQQAVEVDMSTNLNMFVLPGEAQYVSGLSYYIPSEKDILEVVNEHFNPYDKPITKLDTVNLTSIKNQASQESKKPVKNEEKDPEILEEQKQEQSDIAGEKKPTGDKATSGEKDTTTKPSENEDPDASDKPGSDADGTSTPVDTTPQEEPAAPSKDDQSSGSSDVVLNEFGQPYVPDSASGSKTE